MSNAVDYNDYVEAYKKEMEYRYAVMYKINYTKGTLYLSVAYAIGYVFAQLKVSATLIKDSLLAENFENYYDDFKDMPKDIKRYSSLVTEELKDGNCLDVEKINAIFGKLDIDEEDFDLSYAKQMVGEIISSLSFLLANQGISKDTIIKTILGAKLFANLFSEDEIKKLYKQGMYNFLNQIIAEMHNGYKKDYAIHMDKQKWLVNWLLDNDALSKETLKTELEKVIEYSMSCIDGFIELGYPYYEIDSIFPFNFDALERKKRK